jgi:hypothetical protein
MNVHYDQKDGIGSVPDNQEISYKGFKVWMVPDMFLKLARKIYIDPQDTTYLYLKNAIKRGKPIGSPFLNVNWDASKKVWTIWDHEGRHRVQAIKDLWPNESMEVHIFPGSGIRARDITPDMLQSFMRGIIAQDKTFVKNPTSEVELKGQKITPQQQGMPATSMQPPPMLETQKQKLKRIRESVNPPIQQRLSQAHNKLYQQFQKILDKEKPCKFDKEGGCEGSRVGYVPKKDVCCRGCRHHGQKGCETKALGCKSWACGEMDRNLSPEARKQWDDLRKKTYQSGMWLVRASKEQEIEHALEKIKYRIGINRVRKWVSDYMVKNPGISSSKAYRALTAARARGENI